MKHQKLKGNLILLIAAVVWGSSFVSQSKGVETVPPLTFNGIRCLLGGAVLVPVILFLDSRKKRKGFSVQKMNRDLWKSGLICGVLFGLASALQTAGMVYTSPGKAGFITALYMVLIPIIRLIAGKKPRPIIWISVLVAVVGLYLMCMESGEGFAVNLGDVMMLLSALAYAFQILAVDYFAPRTDGVKLACAQFFVGGLLNLLGMVFFETPELGAIMGCGIALGYAGFLSCGVGFTFQIVGQKYTDATSASILMSLESVFSALTAALLVACGWEITGGAMSVREIVGCVFMFAAIILVQLPDMNFSAMRGSGKCQKMS